jgi:hypothetical protein
MVASQALRISEMHAASAHLDTRGNSSCNNLRIQSLHLRNLRNQQHMRAVRTRHQQLLLLRGLMVLYPLLLVLEAPPLPLAGVAQPWPLQARLSCNRQQAMPLVVRHRCQPKGRNKDTPRY